MLLHHLGSSQASTTHQSCQNCMLTILKDCKILALLCKVEGEKAKLELKKVVFFNTQDKGNEEKKILLINYKFPLVPYVNKIGTGVKTNQRHGTDRTKENEGVDTKQLGKQATCNLILKRLNT